jgi:hypothetical protein
MASSVPSSGTNESLTSRERFGLNESDKRTILVYNHPHGLENSSEEKLCKVLDGGKFAAFHAASPATRIATAVSHCHDYDDTANRPFFNTDRNLRCAKLRIPWGNSRVEVHQQDLFPDRDRSRFAHMPTMKLSLASVNLPRPVYWKRLLGQYRDLYIVSPESSPNNSPESSQQISPNSTFKPEQNTTDGAAKR